MLDISNVAQYLLGRGALSAATVVDDGLIVRDVSSRHRSFRVEIPSGGGLHLKQGTAPETRASVNREAAVYRELQQANPMLGTMMPPFRDFDQDEEILILGLVDKAEDLRAHHLRTQQFRPDLGAAIGEILAAVHTCLPPTPAAGATTAAPPFFSIYHPGVEIFRNASAANLQLIRIVQASAGLCARLDAVREGLRCEALLHNDIKWVRSPARRHFSVSLTAPRESL